MRVWNQSSPGLSLKNNLKAPQHRPATPRRLYPVLSREAPGRVGEAAALSADLSERLLNAYAAALAAVPLAARQGVKREYDGVRDATLGFLLRHAELRVRQGECGGWRGDDFCTG